MPRTQGDKTRTIPPAGGEYAVGAKVSGRYKILGKLGQGGMGVVYKAHDSRLRRTVALKFLPPELTLDRESRKRFVREAQAAAGLDHPHICTVHEIDEIKGETFIVMPFVAGQSLKDKIASGPVPVNEALDIAAQVAEGLLEAHAKGIIHRDIKPSNILLTEKGKARITDFGLAKLSRGRDLTRTGTIMGTVFYMSPEQARGEAVDRRTDVWSLGVMLYEMLAGEPPFRGPHDQAAMYSIMNKAPASLSSFRSDIPKRIEAAVLKALAKDTARRYQNMQEFIRDLKQGMDSRPVSDRLTKESGVERKRKMPGRDRDNTQAYEYYLKARQEIVNFTEDGMRRALEHLRNGLETLGENTILYAGMGYACFQYANLGLRQKEYIRKTEEYARKAIQHGPESAPGQLLLGLIHHNFRGNQAQAIHHFKRALALDANDPDALYWLSLCYGFVGRTHAAVPLAERLQKIDPKHPLGFLIRARLFYCDGRYDLALKAISESHKASAQAPIYRFWHALMLFYNGRLKEAAEAIDQTAATAQRDIWTQMSLILKSSLEGDKKTMSSLFSQDLKQAAQRDCQAAFLAAIFYAMLNDNKLALSWLEIAAGRGFINYPYLAVCDPFLDIVRAGTRFAKFIERVKREWVNFKV